MGKNTSMLSTAIKELAPYFGVKSLSDYYYKATFGKLAGLGSQPEATPPPVEAGPAAPQVNIAFDAQGAMADFCGGLLDGGMVSKDIIDCDLAEGNLDVTKIEDFGAEAVAAEEARGKLEENFLFVCDETFKDILKLSTASWSTPMKFRSIYPTSGLGLNELPIPTKTQPGFMQCSIANPALNLSSRDTGAVQVFMNSIPTLEWSRCVPYLDARVIMGGAAVAEDGRISQMGQPMFLLGRTKLEPDSLNHLMASAMPKIPGGPAELFAAYAKAMKEWTEAGGGGTEPPKPEIEPSTFSVVGMEIFTSPQTLIPVNESYMSYDEIGVKLSDPANKAMLDTGMKINGIESPVPGTPNATRAAPILDRMRPLMTLNDVTISVKASRGLMSTKTAQINITLHDRSRLAEIAPFVKPALYGKTEIMLEYGWSHPDSGPGSRNSFGKFLGAMRCKEKYGVMNSKYTFTNDGQVKITLQLVTRGASAVNWTSIGMDKSLVAKWKGIEDIIEVIQTMRREILGIEGMKDVAGMSTIASISLTNIGDVLSGEKLAEINKFLEVRSKPGEASAAVTDLQAALTTLKEDGETFKSTVGEVLTKKKKEMGNGIDPFMKDGDGNNATYGVTPMDPAPVPGSAWCSLGKIMALFFGIPLAQSGKFDEVQMYFYPFNRDSGYMRGKTTANFPINISTFNSKMTKYMEDKMGMSVAQFMSFMRLYFLNNSASEGYGFTTIYSRDDETGKAKVVAGTDASSLKSKKDALIAAAYGITDEDPGVKYKPPRIRIVVEAVPCKDTGSPPAGTNSSMTILRIHVIDQQCTKNAGLSDVLRGARSSQIGQESASIIERTKGWKDSPVDWSVEMAAIVNSDGPAVKAGIIEVSEGTFRVVGGPPAIKYFMKTHMPYIQPGTQGSAVNQVQVATMHNPKDLSIYMIRAQREGGNSQGPQGEQDRGIATRMMPATLTMDMMGCPLLNFAQEFFVDLGTGTTLDNIYVVVGIEHKISPGKFTTSAKFAPGNAWGEYESTINILNSAIAECEKAIV